MPNNKEDSQTKPKSSNRTWKILGLTLLILSLPLWLCCGSNDSSDDIVKETSITKEDENNETDEVTEEPEQKEEEEEKEIAIEEESEPEPDETTIGERNALKSAVSYLDYSAFSYSGLVEQLEYEEYSNEDAVYAVENCGADWNEQAALSAQSYIDYTAFSRSGLIEQLEYEGFTPQQAEYGVKAIGY